MTNHDIVRDGVLAELRYAAKAYSESLLEIESSARQTRESVLEGKNSLARVTGQFFENVARDSARFEAALNLARFLNVEEDVMSGIIKEAASR